MADLPNLTPEERERLRELHEKATPPMPLMLDAQGYIKNTNLVDCQCMACGQHVRVIDADYNAGKYDYRVVPGGFLEGLLEARNALPRLLAASEELERVKEKVQDEVYLRGNQLAAISSVLMANTPVALSQCRLPTDYALYTAAFQDAVSAIEREIKERERADRAQKELTTLRARVAELEGLLVLAGRKMCELDEKFIAAARRAAQTQQESHI